MVGVGAISTQIWFPQPTNSSARTSNHIICLPDKISSNQIPMLSKIPTFSLFPHFSLQKDANLQAHCLPRAATDASSEYKEEPATNVKFQTTLSLPGCSSSLSLLGTGYREKVFVIVPVKVYASGFYVNQSIFNGLNVLKGRTVPEMQQESSLFDSIFQAPLEKSLHIVLVRDVDGKTFWDALDDAISPKIKSPTPVDQSALSMFRSIFQGQPLKKGTSIFLTWLDPTKMLVCVSAEGMPPGIDATIESKNVTRALFDVFFGGDPVSPSLKASVATGLAAALK